MITTYKTNGVCSTAISIDVEGDIVRKIRFESGCRGNLEGISKLTEGMKVDEVIDRCRGIKCGYKATSCPDQLAIALEEMKKNIK